MNQGSFQSILEKIKENFTCFICLEVVSDPCVLSCCGQIVCKKCILPWVEEHLTCPYCRHIINSSQLISIKWFDNLKNIVSLLKENQYIDNICEKHNKQNEFYCNECNEYLCGECIFNEIKNSHKKHEGHKIIKIKDKIKKLKLLIIKELQNLKPEMDKIEKECYEILKNISNLSHQKNMLSLDLYTCFSDVQKRYENEFNKINNELSNQLETLKMSQKEIKNIISTLESIQFNENTDFTLVLSIIEDIASIKDKTFICNTKNTIPFIENELLPQYYSIKILIPNFKDTVINFREANESSSKFIYSSKITAGGNVWKAKIYPNGNGNGLNNYLSLFFELIHGYPKESTYYYKMEIFSNIPEEENLQKQYASIFVENDSWGWNKAASLDTILNGHYLDENGGLSIQLSIKPESYYQEYRDIQYAINRKKQKYHNLKMLEDKNKEIKTNSS